MMLRNVFSLVVLSATLTSQLRGEDNTPTLPAVATEAAPSTSAVVTDEGNVSPAPSVTEAEPSVASGLQDGSARQVIESKEIIIRAKSPEYDNDLPLVDDAFDPFELPPSPSKELVDRKKKIDELHIKYEELQKQLVKEVDEAKFNLDGPSEDINVTELREQAARLRSTIEHYRQETLTIQAAEEGFIGERDNFQDSKYDYLPSH